MDFIYDENNNLINLNNLSLLSSKGSEFLVYHDSNYVYKLYKKEYKLEHKTINELDCLKKLNTKRILMPKLKLFNNNELIGYTMKYIQGEKNIFKDNFSDLLNEMFLIQEDVEILSRSYIRLMDINKRNSAYNGKMFLIDPGNYIINDIITLQPFFQGEEINEKSKIKIIRMMNYVKINKLFYDFLFISNPKIDIYLLRKIYEFFEKEREKNELLYDFEVYKKYFNRNLSVKDSIDDFIEKYITIEEEEKKLLLPLLEGKKWLKVK